MTVPFELHDAAELGAVDARGVRVWIRAPGQSSVTARLEVEGWAPVDLELPVREEDDWVGVAQLALPEPAPGAPFVVRVGERSLTGRLAPSVDDRGGFTFGFGSCIQLYEGRDEANLSETGTTSIFRGMIQELRNADARFVLLIGDQIYSELPEALSVRRDPSAPGGPSFADMLARYRRAYRASFGHPDFRAVREAFPTYCTWDDHDILADWGSRYEGGGPVFAAASRAFCEYQHLRNPGGSISQPPYHFAFCHGDVAFLVLDSRGERSLRKGQILGEGQWAALDAVLAPGPGPPVSTLFLVLTVPIAHAATWFVRVAERSSDRIGIAARDRWNSRAFSPERDRLLHRLLAWQQGAPNRQVILLSGDVHAANAFTIRPRRGPGVIRQLTSSPLTTPIPRLVRWFTPVVARGTSLFEPDFTFERHIATARHNFGLVRVDPLASGGHRVELTLHPGPFARLAFEPGD